MQSVTRATLIIGLVFLAALRTSAGPTQDRITILYDPFGKPSGMKKDWGYSALVEHGGKHILFDTGNNAKIFAQNVKVSGVDLKKLDFAVISHRARGSHGWHELPFDGESAGEDLCAERGIWSIWRLTAWNLLSPRRLTARLYAVLQWEAAADDDLRHAVATRQFCSN